MISCYLGWNTAYNEIYFLKGKKQQGIITCTFLPEPISEEDSIIDADSLESLKERALLECPYNFEDCLIIFKGTEMFPYKYNAEGK